MRVVFLSDVNPRDMQAGDIALDHQGFQGDLIILRDPHVVRVKSTDRPGVKTSYLVWKNGEFTYYHDDHLGSANRFLVMRYVD